jgi:hypothetical protein
VLVRAADFFNRQAEERHVRLFEKPHRFPRSPSGLRAEDVLGEAETEGFVSIEEAA